MVISNDIIIMHSAAFILNLGCGILGISIPYMIGKKNPQKAMKVLSYLNCLVGGVLLGVSMIHIMPEASKQLNPLVDNLPLSFYISFTSLIVIVLVIKAGGHTHDSIEENPLHEHSCNEQHLVKKKSTSKIVVLCVGLMIHDLSEGISLGLSTTFTDIIILFAAIFLHKWCDLTIQAIAGIHQGLSFKNNLKYLIPLCLATPTAQLVTFVILICTQGQGTMPVTVTIAKQIFLSFAAGTFIGIAFEEVIEVEMAHAKKAKEIVWKTLTLFGGFVFVALGGLVERFSPAESD